VDLNAGGAFKKLVGGLDSVSSNLDVEFQGFLIGVHL
jgi:hypothetical protein